jgi:hemoglobin
MTRCVFGLIHEIALKCFPSALTGRGFRLPVILPKLTGPSLPARYEEELELTELEASQTIGVPPHPTITRTPQSKGEHSLYEQVGGEQGLRDLVETFYDIVENDPNVHDLHLLHLRGHGVAHSRIEQFDFLSGFLGGPQLYVEKHGHSNVRTMHEHIEINASTKDMWLNSMSTAIDKVGLPHNVKHELMAHFTRIANMLQNRF